MKVSPAVLLRLFSYDEEKGLLYWKSPTGHRVKMGDEVGAVSHGRLRTQVFGKTYAVHQIIWAMKTGVWANDQIDHIDRDRLNNRFSNLRTATNAENCRNRGNRANTTGYKGVSFRKGSQKFVARIMFLGKVIYLGSYADARNAAREYNKAAKEYFGEFALLNNIEADHHA